jgi:hypothetical protein
MKHNLAANRLVELTFHGTPEQAEELAFLEEYQKWKAAGGPNQVEAKRLARFRARSGNEDRLLGLKAKKL